MGLFGFNKKDFNKNTEVIKTRITEIARRLRGYETVKRNEEHLELLRDFMENISLVYVWRANPRLGQSGESFDKRLLAYLDEIEQDTERKKPISATLKLVALVRVLFSMTNPDLQITLNVANDLFKAVDLLIKAMTCHNAYQKSREELDAIDEQLKKINIKECTDEEFQKSNQLVDCHNKIVRKQNQLIEETKLNFNEYKALIEKNEDKAFLAMDYVYAHSVTQNVVDNIGKLSKGMPWYESKLEKQVQSLMATLNFDLEI